MQVTLDIKESAVDKIMYFLEHLKDDVKIMPHHQNSLKLEVVNENDPDYSYIIKARQRRANGEKTYSLDELLQEFE